MSKKYTLVFLFKNLYLIFILTLKGDKKKYPNIVFYRDLISHGKLSSSTTGGLLLVSIINEIIEQKPPYNQQKMVCRIKQTMSLTKLFLEIKEATNINYVSLIRIQNSPWFFLGLMKRIQDKMIVLPKWISNEIKPNESFEDIELKKQWSQLKKKQIGELTFDNINLCHFFVNQNQLYITISTTWIKKSSDEEMISFELPLFDLTGM